MKHIVLALLLGLSGCAVLKDPARHGTAYMRSEWAKADPCVRTCAHAFPGESTLAFQAGNKCRCETARINMGPSYYANDPHGRPEEQTALFILPTLEEQLTRIEAYAKKLSESPCLTKSPTNDKEPRL